MVARLPAAGRAVLLLAIAAVVAIAASVTVGAIVIDLGSSDLFGLAGWLGGAAILALLIGTVLVVLVDRAADGRYVVRLGISAIAIVVVYAIAAGLPLGWWLTGDATRSMLWLLLGHAAVIAATFGIFAAWLDATPIEEAARAVVGVAGGRYSARLPETGNDEIAEIGAATNVLAARAQSAAIRQSNQDRARESLLMAIAADAQIPLDSIRTILQSLAPAPGREPIVTTRHLEAIGRETSQLQHRIDEVEEIARLETGQITLRLQPLSLAQLVIAVCDRLQPGAATRNIIIGPSVDFSLPRVLADPDQTYRAIESLVRFAISETPDGGNLAVELHEAGPFVQLTCAIRADEGERSTAARIEWDSAHRQRASALSLAVAGRIIEIQGGSFLISRGSAPLVVVSLPRS